MSPTRLFWGLAVMLALTLAWPVFAQDITSPVAAGEMALTELIQTGVLGTICVILMIVIGFLYKKNEKQQDKIVEMTSELTKLFTENSIVTKRQVELLEKVLERRNG
jgi:hypothetical protein